MRTDSLRQWLARVLLTTAMLIAVVWAGSLYWWASYHWACQGGTRDLRLAGGGLSFCTFRAVPPPRLDEMVLLGAFNTVIWSRAQGHRILFRPGPKRMGPFLFIVLPLWIPFLAAMLPGVWLWWTNRRIRAGHCIHCSYDLTGNASGVCPECGERI